MLPQIDMLGVELFALPTNPLVSLRIAGPYKTNFGSPVGEVLIEYSFVRIRAAE